MIEMLGNGDSFDLKTPKNPAFVADLKAALPAGSRRWTDRFVWEIASVHRDTVVKLVVKHYGQQPVVGGHFHLSSQVKTHALLLEYLGAPKQRDNGDVTSTGWVDGNGGKYGNLVMPLAVLAGWFGVTTEGNQSKPVIDARSYYTILGVPEKATPEELKKGYRQAARTYHPDVNREPDAADQFKRIKEAYDTLCNPALRLRYDAARFYVRDAAPLPSARNDYDPTSWRPPVRCGRLTVEATVAMGIYTVKKIIAWQDVTNGSGQVMVSAWTKGGEYFEVKWR